MVDLDIHEGEILALLGPNGAGKTTLISIICGIVSSSSGSVTVAGHDIVDSYRVTRNLIGLVPQELTLGAFDTVWNTVNFSRGLFGKKPNPAYLTQLLKDLSLWDKKNNELRELSGGMKRRVLIAKALSHEPRILFLDEPTAGVDVELRQDMWKMVRRLNDSGVTIILTTHYIEEAEEIADRVGIINQGRLLLVDDKQNLMQKLGKKQLLIELKQSIDEIPSALAGYKLETSADGTQLIYTYDTRGERTGITSLLQALHEAGLSLKDLKSSQSSLEEIFVSLVSTK
jgi:ABC-2 type transport system ATP-binding protein